MATKIIGDLNVRDNVIIGTDNAVRSVNSVDADQNGNIDIPMYSQDYVDKVFSMLPVTRIGSMDYLPMNINGSFEGSTTLTTHLIPNIVEADGTFVYLRAGTNGSNSGFYYSFLKNSRNSSSLIGTLSNSKYTPGISNLNVKYFIGSKGSDVLMMRASVGASEIYLLGLTNGTFDVTSHEYIQIPKASISGYPQYAHIVSDKVYIWGINDLATSSMSISLHTINVQDIRNGVYTSLTKITGFNGKNIYNENINSASDIVIASVHASPDPTDKPLFYVSTGVSSVQAFTTNDTFCGGYLHAQENVDNSKIRVAMYCSFRPVIVGVLTAYSTVGISVVYDISSKTYSHDRDIGNPITLTYDGNVNISSTYYTDMADISGSSDQRQGNLCSLYQTDDGVLFSNISKYVTNPAHAIYRMNVQQFTNAYDSWNLKTRSLVQTAYNEVPPFFGSAIGENIIHPRLCSTGKIIVACGSTSNGHSNGYSSLSSTEFSGAPTYVYDSISGGTINGYAPNKNRVVLDNSDGKFIAPISIVDQNGTVRMYGSSFLEGSNKFSGGLLDSTTMTFNASYTIAGNVLGDLKTQMINSSGLDVNQSKILLYYVPESTYCKSFAVCVCTLNTAVGGVDSYSIISEVDVVLNSSQITSASVLSTNNIKHTNLGVNITGDIARQGGLTIARYNDFTYISIYSVFGIVNPSNHIYTTSIGKIDISSKMLTNIIGFECNYLSAAGGTYGSGVIPNVGFGLFKHGTITDSSTKCVFNNYGTTSAQMDVLMSNISAATPISTIVITSQDVPEGYLIYFTQEIPVLLSGKYFKLPAQTIDLQSLFSTVQNKTFYVYVSIINDVPQYQISETLLTEEIFRVYIGTIITDASGIDSIVTEKVTRFLTYRTSTTKRGSAIPTSTGVPSGTGSRWR